MARPIPANQASQIIAIVPTFAGGASFIDVATSMNPTPRVRNLQRWLRALVQQERLIRTGKSVATRYTLPAVASVPPVAFASAAGQAIKVLVNEPIQCRPPVDFHRTLLDAYRPNETTYVTADLRARMVAKGATGAWRTPAGFDATLCALVTSIMALEDAFDAFGVRAGRSTGGAGASLLARAIQPLTAADIVKVLRDPVRQGVRADVQLVWGMRSILPDLVNHGAALTLTPALIAEVYARVCRAWSPDPATGIAARRTEPPPALTLRRSCLTIADTVYRPVADSALIETCYRHLLRVAGEITDPVERAFFLLVHLVYLLPFETLNPTMTLLIMNVPLLAAGMAPVTFAGVSPSDLLSGIRGVWELGRIDLQRDAFFLVQ